MGLAAVAVGSFLLECHPMPWRWRPRGPLLLEAGLLLAVVGLAIWLRLPDLATVPPNVHGDEADVGLLARDILAGRMQVLFATAPAAEATAVTFALHAATMRVFGDNLFGLRMASAIEGVVSIVLLYLFARRVWGPRPALLAASFMAVAAWHIHFSRTGFHYMQAPVAMLLALYFLVRGLQDRRVLDWVVCGFAIGAASRSTTLPDWRQSSWRCIWAIAPWPSAASSARMRAVWPALAFARWSSWARMAIVFAAAARVQSSS